MAQWILLPKMINLQILISESCPPRQVLIYTTVNIRASAYSKFSLLTSENAAETSASEGLIHIQHSID